MHQMFSVPWSLAPNFLGLDPREQLIGLELMLIVLLATNIVVLLMKLRVTRNARLSLQEVEDTLEDVSAQEAVLREVAKHANDGLVYQDMNARILWANPAYCRTMGWELEDILGRRPQEFCFPEEVRPTAEEVENFVFDPESYEFKQLVRRLNIRKNGERFWHEFNLSLVEPRPGDRRVILVSRDVTPQVLREQELERARAELHHAAHHDALTGLNNRTAFLDATDRILSAPRAQDRTMGLLYIDLDHFKAVNDTHGHGAGDRLLCHVAAAIRAMLGERDLACRMGGDEFVVACPGVTDFDTLQHVADGLLDRIRTPIPWGETTLVCNASLGIALSDGMAMTAEDLIRSADFALYEAKRPGAPNIARYDAELHSRQEAENALMEEFATCLDRDAVDFVYQPILDARTGKIRSFETLARWTRESGEVVAPDRFLPYAARLNRMADIDFAAIRATSALVADLEKRGHRIRGAFNTSSEALAHPDFMARLEFEAREAGLSSEALVAEVLETTFFGPDTTDSLAAARINELRKQGFSVYLDDFGVGYAGLAHLGQLDVSGVKLDRSLVANVVHDRSARIITTSILRLCDELGVGTLAEGIETAEQAEFLYRHGCYRLQGFGIARPMPRDDVIALVESGAPIVIPSEGSQIPRSA
ncbi:bifunctional diguanylate cyclase/phosphodiesterase [Hasllibacter sp. MH4015]|uniref:putative bifunctional diguanylate cyclase/phosphodiesterase n=1 Tax=Hasllibacter sp. MH4015 TaxID=2854029 RepID=UPI001CD4BFF4|nr:EAL domain-containing protein [Hasllibacter sp. MH4015]